MPFHSYMNFDGTTRAAMTRYHEIFGGDLNIMSFADMPAEEGAPPVADPNLVMHAGLVTDNGILMASDVEPGTLQAGRNVYVNYSTTDLDDGKRVFDALSDGGEIEMPWGAQFWAPGFGICHDEFGTAWMVSVDIEGYSPH